MAMLSALFRIMVAVVGLSGVMSGTACAQLTQVTTSSTTVSDSFFEQIGFGFGYFSDHLWFNGPGLAPPPFGGHNATGSAGFGFRQGNCSFQFTANQGSNRSFGGQSVGVVVPHVGTGVIMSGTLRPYVTGFIPVVGGGVPVIVGLPFPNSFVPAPPVSPVSQVLERIQAGDVRGPPRRAAATPAIPADRQNPDAQLQQRLLAARSSSAGRGDISVAEIHAHQAQREKSQSSEVFDLVQRGHRAEKNSKPKLARTYYQMAARLAAGRMKQELAERLKALESPQP